MAKKFSPSEMQARFFDWIKNGTGSAVLIAVAGSGKSTSLAQSVPYIPAHQKVLILGFNVTTAKDIGEKVKAMGAYPNVWCRTFHSLGFGAVTYRLKVKQNAFLIESNKVRKLCSREWEKEFFAAAPASMSDNEKLAFARAQAGVREEMYGSFVSKLVGYAKGQGIGTRLCPDTGFDVWQRQIDHHDLDLEHEEATVEEGIRLARAALLLSNKVAKDELWIDYDDMLYLPILWGCRMFQQDWVYIDEAQDTNPVRRELARMSLKPSGRLVAVGDPKQAIYGFTGASHDAIELIKTQFRAIELPLTVSYRCPQAVVPMVQKYVPYFQVHESNPQGSVSTLDLKEALPHLIPSKARSTAILCRNTKPLVQLAYQLLSQKVACTVLGSEIGAGLISLIRKMKAKTIDGLTEKLEQYAHDEIARLVAKKEENKAELVADRVECIMVFIAALDQNSRTIRKLIDNIEGMFSDQTRDDILPLSTAHKAKGREWDAVALLQPELMPSKWARQEWQQDQEENLIYVAYTRTKDAFIFISNDNQQAEKEAA